VIAYLGLGIGVPIVIGLWARAWNRGSATRWAAVAFLMTPFGAWIVALVLLIRGPRTRSR